MDSLESLAEFEFNSKQHAEFGGGLDSMVLFCGSSENKTKICLKILHGVNYYSGDEVRLI